MRSCCLEIFGPELWTILDFVPLLHLHEDTETPETDNQLISRHSQSSEKAMPNPTPKIRWHHAALS